MKIYRADNIEIKDKDGNFNATQNETQINAELKQNDSSDSTTNTTTHTNTSDSTAAPTSNRKYTAFKGIGMIAAPPMKCLRFFAECENKSCYDEIFEKAHIVEELDLNTRIENHLYWAPPFISKRDFCMLGHGCQLQDQYNTLMLLAFSTKHEKCPPVN